MDYKEKVIALLNSKELSQEQKEKLESIFSELKESEDERIRKEIIESLRHQMDKFNDAPNILRKYNEWIAWLEKQGEQKPFDYDNATIVQQDFAPKDKPKFKVGDWVINKQTSNIYLVRGIRDDEYFLWPLDAKIEGFLRIVDVDSEYRLWTIQDAKDGDVLSYVTDEEALWIMIYWSLYEPYEGHVHYHALLVNNKFSDKGTCCINIDNLKPATKEQRDTLMKAMDDAGYTFDFEKKELKEIEQAFTWSEEDETIRKALINLIERCSGIYIDKTEKNRLLDWLKSIKPQNT